MFTIAFVSLLASVQPTTITLPETVITVRSIARPEAGKLVHCGAPRALATDSVQTVRVCEVAR